MHAGRLADDADEPTTIAALGHDCALLVLRQVESLADLQRLA